MHFSSKMKQKMCSSLLRACNLNSCHHGQRVFYALIGYKLLQINFKLEIHWRSLIYLALSKLLFVRYGGFPLPPPTHFPSLLKIASSLNHYHCNYNKRNQQQKKKKLTQRALSRDKNILLYPKITQCCIINVSIDY